MEYSASFIFAQPLKDLEGLQYKELGYTCHCPNDKTFLYATDVAFDSLYYQTLNIDCD